MEQRTLETIIYEKDGPIARITLNTPDKANIQTAQQVWDMEDCLRDADRDEAVKVLVLKANGKGFCAGHAIVDQEQMAEVYPTSQGPPERNWKNHGYDLFTRPPIHLWEFPKATISQVHGYCLGGGTVYASLTDLTVASEDAYFQMPLPQGFGLPGAQTMVEPWLFMSWKRTYEYLYLAPTFEAHEARERGIVNTVVPRDELDAAVEEQARTVARMPLTTIMAIKQGVRRAWESMGMRVHMQYSNDLLSVCTSATDVHEYMAEGAGRRPRQFAERRTGSSGGDSDADT